MRMSTFNITAVRREKNNIQTLNMISGVDDGEHLTQFKDYFHMI